jgi:hypothetical protein
VCPWDSRQGGALLFGDCFVGDCFVKVLDAGGDGADEVIEA